MWKSTKEKPLLDKPITVVHNVYITGKTELRITTGIVKHKQVNGWGFLRAGDDEAVFIPVTDIHGWCYEEHLVKEVFFKVHREPVEIVCPHCGELTTVTAHATYTNYVTVPTAMNTLTGRVCLDWDGFDAECDFEYLCDHCGEGVAPSLETVDKIAKKQTRPLTDFTDDAEKMRDFYRLSKEEFLKSYSYITEEEWELTMEKINNLIKGE